MSTCLARSRRHHALIPIRDAAGDAYRRRSQPCLRVAWASSPLGTGSGGAGAPLCRSAAHHRPGDRRDDGARTRDRIGAWVCRTPVRCRHRVGRRRYGQRSRWPADWHDDGPGDRRRGLRRRICPRPWPPARGRRRTRRSHRPTWRSGGRRALRGSAFSQRRRRRVSTPRSRMRSTRREPAGADCRTCASDCSWPGPIAANPTR